jgi:hypothetical protein
MVLFESGMGYFNPEAQLKSTTFSSALIIFFSRAI